MELAPLLIDVGSELIIGLVLLFPVWKIFQRAGFSGGWALLMLVPFFGMFLAMLILAIRVWPNLYNAEERT